MNTPSRNDIMRIISEQREELARRFSVTSIALFGSFARGEENSGSDVDILVEFAEPTFDHYMDLKFYLEDLFERPVDLVMPDTIKSRIKPVIEKEALHEEIPLTR